MHPHAEHAVRAARNMHRWGWYATIRYIRKRGVPFSLFTLARVLEHFHQSQLAGEILIHEGV